MAAEALTARERHRLEIEARDPWACALAGYGPCSGPYQADHILKVRALLSFQADLRIRSRRLSLRPQHRAFVALSEDEIAADARNGWLLCRDGHHVPKDRGEINPIEFVILPEHYFDFLVEYLLLAPHERAFVRPAQRAYFGHGPGTTRRHGGRARDPRA